MPYKNKADLYKYQTQRWTERKKQMIEYKGGVCRDCGWSGPHQAFDFHHRDKTEKEMSWNKTRLVSKERMMLELDKCDLLCARCHRLRHIR